MRPFDGCLRFPLGSARSHRALVYVCRYTMIALCTLFWGMAACLIGAVDRSGEGGVFSARCWVRWILRSCRVQVESIGLEAFDPSRCYVFMSNHQSVFDVAASAAVLPVSFRFVAKRVHEDTNVIIFPEASRASF
jgi:1-acyl-sn-glycerol-3-phosphate acyltransferase